MTAGGHGFRRRLDWNLLRTFHAIVQAGGVTAAAETINRNQPAVSLSLKRLEAAVGTRLCRRGPGGFELTDAGVLVAEIAAEVHRLVGEIPYRVANVSEEVQGVVRIALISSLVNPDLDRAIAAFHDRYPQLRIEVDVAPWDAVGRMLLKDEADIGIAPADYVHHELTYEPLFLEAHRVYCGAAHPLFGAGLQDPAQLGRHAFVLTGADEPTPLTKHRLRLGLGQRVAGTTEHLEEAKRLLALGVGIGFLPEGFAGPEVARGELWPLTRPTAETTVGIYVITNPQAPRRLPRAFLLAELRDRFGTAAAAE